MKDQIKIKKLKNNIYKVYSNVVYNTYNIKKEGWIYMGEIKYNDIFKCHRYQPRFFVPCYMGKIYLRRIAFILTRLDKENK